MDAELIIRIAQFVLSLSILIILHEFGHFLPAKLFGVRVEKFYLFFDPYFSVLKKKIGETEYGIGWLPLGGYVKLSGMIDESMDKDQMKEEPKPYEFRSKPAWQRLIIMLGGVIVNVILGYFIYIMVAFNYGDIYLPNSEVKDGIWVNNKVIDSLGIHTGDKIISADGKKIVNFSDVGQEILLANNIELERNGKVINVELPEDFIGQLLDNIEETPIKLRQYFFVDSVPSTSINAGAGFQSGDRLVKFDSMPITYYDQYLDAAENYKNQTTTIEVEREGQLVPLTVAIDSNGKLELYRKLIPLEDYNKEGLYHLDTAYYTFSEAIPAGIKKGNDKMNSYVKQMSKVFNPSTGAIKGIGGFGTMSKMFPSSWNWEVFWLQTAFLSIILAIMNILPIPALDGGHVVFLLYEMVTGRKPNEKVLEYAQITGFVLLISLFLYANGMDIIRAIGN